MSKVIYMIQVLGGGVQKIHLDKLQKILNSSARFVLNGGRNWRTLRLMNACGWLRMDELLDFHTLIMLW